MSITFDGVNSDDLGVIVERIPNPQIAARRANTEVVPGRNGVLLQDDGSFATEILKDLVAQGYSGDELIHAFENQQKNITKAISDLSTQADDIAYGRKKGASVEEVFGEE